MITPRVEIIIDDRLLIKGCSGFVIDKSVENLSAKGEVKLPLRAVYRGQGQSRKLILSEEIKRGQSIVVRAGYLESQIYEVFRGNITQVQKGAMLTVQMEDDVYKLRKKQLVLHEENISLKTLIEKLVSGTGIQVSDLTNDILIDRFEFAGNAAAALARIKESLSIAVYFDDKNELYAGGQLLNLRETINCVYGRNVIKNRVEYTTADTNPVMVEVIGKTLDGKEVKVIAGMEGGNKHTLYRFNVTDEGALRLIADEYLKTYSFDGFVGNLDLFFMPYGVPGGSVNYTNNNYEFEEGRYHIKAVKYESAREKGLKQSLTLGAKLG